MGRPDHKRTQRTTRRLDAQELAGLTRRTKATTRPAATKTAPPATRPSATTPPPTTIPPDISVSRAMTVEDPMTTQLLAEVARRSETIDFDDSTIDEALEAIDKNVVTTSHPHLTRRKRKT